MVWTELHHLCGSKEHPWTIESIISRCLTHPEEIGATDDRGYTPLHVEADRADHPREEVVDALLQSNPVMALTKKEYTNGNTPLHLALWPGVDPKVVRLMIDACPTVAFEKDKEGLMPLHVACRHCPDNHDVMRILVEANPKALRSRTRMGNVVAKQKKDAAQQNQHLVLDGRTSSAWQESQIEMMADRRRRRIGLNQQVRDGSYPLHMAIASAAPKQVLQMLVDGAPEIAAKTDKFGRTCLHVAVKNAAEDADDADAREAKPPMYTMEEIMLVHSMHPAQVKTRDRDGQLPLHIACESGCSVDIIKYLVRSFPDAIHIKNKDGKRPSDVAIPFGSDSKEIIDCLAASGSASGDVQLAQ